jgi:hypothetical protein
MLLSFAEVAARAADDAFAALPEFKATLMLAMCNFDCECHDGRVRINIPTHPGFLT